MLPHFHTLYLETTRKCNLSCKYCSTGSNGKYDDAVDMSFDDIVNRILIPAYNLGTKFVGFSGGEPLMRKDIYDLLYEANKIGLRIGIVTNGTLLNDKVLKKIKSILGDNLIVSLGINSFDKDNITTRDLPVDFTLKQIELLQSHHIRVNISVTIGKFNIHTFPDTIKTIQNLGLPYNRIPFVPRNNPEAYDLMLDKNILRKYFHPTLRNYFGGGTSYHPYFLPYEIYKKISGQTEEKNGVPTNPSVGCWVGSYYAINPEGEVAPCPMFLDHVSGGNVLKQNLKDILYESDLFKKIVQRDKLEGKCGKCKYHFTCGGCRVMAYYMTGNVFAQDPNCFLDQLSEKEIKIAEKETEKSFKNYVRMAQVSKIYIPPSDNDIK